MFMDVLTRIKIIKYLLNHLYSDGFMIKVLIYKKGGNRFKLQNHHYWTPE